MWTALVFGSWCLLLCLCFIQEDTVPVENITNSGACLLYCTCAHYGCYHGTVPCECEGPRSPCEENRTMDPVTGGMFVSGFLTFSGSNRLGS